MKKNDLRNALSGINKEYLSESDDFKTVSADFRKQKTFKIKAITTTLCLAFVGVGAIGITQSGLLNRKLQTLDEEISTVSSAESTPIATDAKTESTPMAIDATTNTAVQHTDSSVPKTTTAIHDDSGHQVIWAEDMNSVNEFDEGFTVWHQFDSVGYRLYEALEAGDDDDVFAILARPSIDYTFIYNGKTLAEYDSDMYNERILPDLLCQLLKEGDSLKYGEALYKTGTPTGEKWAQSLYEERIAYYGETILRKYIVNGEFLSEIVEQDISSAMNSNEATAAYETAYGAYLNQVASSINGVLPAEVVAEDNGIIMYLTKDEFSKFSADRIDGWTFDLAFKNGETTYQYGGDE